ncbi:hypothetical protein [Peterkaempfera bronchialis]|uniref:hypothetical protein n=1 Tax=Peterkaempfera bronchialis TaxID=2126346 RepID=UPI003C2EA5E1
MRLRPRGRTTRAWTIGTVVALLFAAAGPAAAAGPGTAEPTGGKQLTTAPPTIPFASVEGTQAHAFAVQSALDQAADRIRAVADSLAPARDGSGFAGDRVDVAGNAVTLYWHGTVPAKVRSAVTDARRAGITVTVESAAYTFDQLLAETDRLVREVRAVGDRAITSAGPRPDGNGVQVSVAPAPAGFAAQSLQQVDAELTRSVALDVTTGEAPRAASRLADSAPFWGSAYADIYSGSTYQGSCTTGFGVAGNNGAARYLLTAAHCGGGQWRTALGTVIGSVIPTQDLSHDAELILTDAGNGIYEGASIQVQDTYSGRLVTSASTSHVGDSICHGGAFTGSICGYVVAGVGQSFTIGGFGAVKDMVQAEAPNHVSGLGNGDSGGPVYTINSSGYGVARGTVSAYSGVASEEVDCPGVPTGGGRHCSWKWWYPDVTKQLAGVGVHF